MLFNLIELWKNVQADGARTLNSESLSHTYPKNTQQAAIKFDTSTAQSSFEFNISPNVIIVDDIKTLKPVLFYDDLPCVVLTSEEEKQRQDIILEQQAKNPRFFDGKQMLITGIVYDDEINTIYMEARQVPYSFIVALNSKRFPENSSLYQTSYFKTGVLSPLITRDNQTSLVERGEGGLYSVHGGFLEAQGESKRLNFDEGNIVSKTARAEIIEEIAGIKNSTQLRFDFSEPQITSLSFRMSSTNPVGTAEFVAPARVDCHSRFLSGVISHNLADDAYEHTQAHKIIPLEARERETLLTMLLTSNVKLPGAALFLPVVLSLTRIVNPGNFSPRAVPHHSSVSIPMSVFKSAIPKPPSSVESTDPDDEPKAPSI